MAVISKPDLTRVWAETAPGVNVVDPGNVKFAQGWEIEVPPMEYFNFLQKMFSQGLVNLAQTGIFHWDNLTAYQLYARTQGSDGVIYKSKIANNIGFDPVTNPTQWEDIDVDTTPDWSTTVKGKVEKATQAEAEAGTDNERGMTPLATKQAIAALGTSPDWSETVKGLVEKATSSEALAGSDNLLGMTPLLVKAVLDAFKDDAHVNDTFDIDGQTVDATMVFNPKTDGGGKGFIIFQSEQRGNGDFSRLTIEREDATGDCVFHTYNSGGSLIDTIRLTQDGQVQVSASAPSAVNDLTRKDYVDNQIATIAGTVSLLSTRTTIGTWSITGLTVGKPVIFGVKKLGSGVATWGAGLSTTSGSLDTQYDTPGFLNANLGRDGAGSMIVVPTSTTLTMFVDDSLSSAELRAYQ